MSTEQRIYIYAEQGTYIYIYAEQGTAICITIFHRYRCFINYGGIITNLTPRNPWGYITEMSKCHSAGAWSMDGNIFSFMFKYI